MKKILFILVASLVVVSCSKQKLANMNTDTKAPTTVPGALLFSNAEVKLATMDADINVNDNNFDLWAQYLQETTYVQESQYNVFYRSVPFYAWGTYYRDILANLKRSDSLIKGETTATTAEKANLANRRAIIDIVSCYAWDQMEMQWGNIPYAEALNPDNVFPKYDDAYTIHQDLISRVSADVKTLTAGIGAGSFSSGDLIYDGDVSMWKEFGNGLLIKMAIQIANYSGASSLVTTTIKNAMDGAISSSADNAMFQFLANAPYQSPLYTELVVTGRHDYVAGATLIDKMASLYDPRLDSYFDNKIPVAFKKEYATDTVIVSNPILVYYKDGTKTLKTPVQVNTDSQGKPVMGIVFPAADSSLSPSYYLGGIIGLGNTFASYSHINTKISGDPTFSHPLMTYSEIQFYLAEAAARGIISSSDAATYYDNAVIANIEFWGGTANQAAAYLAQPTVKYNAANWKDLIGTQAWISFYLRGQLGWTEWRRLSAPALVEPQGLYSGVTTFPFRYPYPVLESHLNPDAYNAASTAIGGDNMNTKLYWEK